MTLALDFGSASIKAILVGASSREKSFFSFNLGFRSPVLSRTSLLAAIETVASLSGEKLLDKQRILSKIYACVGLPVYESSEILTSEVVLVGQALASLDLNILDIGSQLIHFRDRVSIAPAEASEVQKWLPFKADIADISNYIENKKIYSSTIPASPRDLFIEQALARVRITDLFRSQRLEVGFPEIYLSGGVFSKVPHYEQALLMVLDSLQPTGVLKIWLDPNGILPVSGVLKFHSLAEFSKLGDEFTPVLLATTLAIPDSCVVTINLGFGEPQEIDLKSGDLYVFPLQLGEQAQVEVRTSAEPKRGRKYEVTGGSIGLVFDLRPRPLEIPDSPRLRCDLLKLWSNQVGASGRIRKI